MFNSIVTNNINVFISTVASAISVFLALFSIWIKKSVSSNKARFSADEKTFEDALASADLMTLGTMLRNRFGTVSVEALLDDKVTQERVFKSLERLTEVVNQPFPEKEEDKCTPSNTKEKNNIKSTKFINKLDMADNIEKKNYLDLLGQNTRSDISKNINDIANRADNMLQKSEIWTALASARRDLEMLILQVIPERRHPVFSSRVFLNPDLSDAMKRFLMVANRAIHGVNTSREEAEAAIRSLYFISKKLPIIDTGSDIY